MDERVFQQAANRDQSKLMISQIHINVLGLGAKHKLDQLVFFVAGFFARNQIELAVHPKNFHERVRVKGEV